MHYGLDTSWSVGKTSSSMSHCEYGEGMKCIPGGNDDVSNAMLKEKGEVEQKRQEDDTEGNKQTSRYSRHI